MTPRVAMTQRELAEKIVHAVALAPAGHLVGSLSVIRGCGLPYGQARRRESQSKVYRAVPLAVELSVDLYPGRVLVVDNSGTWGTYRMLADLDVDATRAVLARLKSARTKEDRARLETSVAKSPGGKMLHQFLKMRTEQSAMLDSIAELIDSENAVT